MAAAHNTVQKSHTSSRWIKAAPNSITAISIFFGFASIIFSTADHFFKAALFIILAAAADTIDGRVARLLRAESKFGIEFDSFADAISFGVAPAVLINLWAFKLMPYVGWPVAFIYMICAILRLVRFNVMHQVEDVRYFQGLPVLTPACLIALFVIFSQNYLDGEFSLIGRFFLAGVVAVLALLMISSVPYRNPKALSSKTLPLPLLVAVVIVWAASSIIWYDAVPFFLFLAYALSGPIEFIVRALSGKR